MSQEPPAPPQYRPIPRSVSNETQNPVWRVRFQFPDDKVFALEINGEILFGRGKEPGLVDLMPYGAVQAGVSRHHLMLRPTASNLFLIDLGSTNGTYRNGRFLNPNTPSRLVDGDTIRLGDLTLKAFVDERPSFQTTLLGQKRPSLEDALIQISKAITSQLNLEEVLNQVTETAMVLTNAGETSIWLVNESSGELQLEAQRGIDDKKIRRKQWTVRKDNLVGQVLTTGKPLRATHKPGSDRIKLQTDYLVEALVYAPITIGGITLGVLAAAHQIPGKQFSDWDEKALTTIADYAAIAIQNARLYEETDQALARRVQELSALNEVSRAVSSSLDLSRIAAVLVEQIKKNWEMEAVRIYLLDPEQNDLRALYRNGDNPRETIRSGIMYHVAKKGKSILSNQVESHPAYKPQTDQLNGRPPQSLAAVPLKFQNRVVGVLGLLNKIEGQFNDEDIERLNAFAHPVAIAIENARLFEESERQRLAIQATAHTLAEPLLILDKRGRLLIANKSAQEIVDNYMPQLFAGISGGIGNTVELTIAENTYLTSSQHLPEVGTIIVMQDITYVKQLEKDRADFMRALSHDLKSPLTSIRGFAQLLERVSTLDEKGKRFINRIITSSDRMLDMVNQLLHVSRSEFIDLEREPCNLSEIVERTRGDIEGAALYKEIELDYEQNGETYLIMASNVAIYHMILNLVDNAVKYSPNNTTVTVSLNYHSDRILLQVHDQGPGIPDSELTRVFDPYFRSKGTIAKPGAGIGLSVVKDIANNYEGEALVRNHPEGGAEFSITLPGSLRIE